MTNKILQKTLELLNNDQKEDLFKSIVSDELSSIKLDERWLDQDFDYQQERLTDLFASIESENYKESLSIISHLLARKICNGS